MGDHAGILGAAVLLFVFFFFLYPSLSLPNFASSPFCFFHFLLRSAARNHHRPALTGSRLNRSGCCRSSRDDRLSSRKRPQHFGACAALVCTSSANSVRYAQGDTLARAGCSVLSIGSRPSLATQKGNAHSGSLPSNKECMLSYGSRQACKSKRSTLLVA